MLTNLRDCTRLRAHSEANYLSGNIYVNVPQILFMSWYYISVFIFKLPLQLLSLLVGILLNGFCSATLKISWFLVAAQLATSTGLDYFKSCICSSTHDSIPSHHLIRKCQPIVVRHSLLWPFLVAMYLSALGTVLPSLLLFMIDSIVVELWPLRSHWLMSISAFTCMATFW